MTPVTQTAQGKDSPASLSWLGRILPQARNRRPFLTGLVLAPVFVFIHEAAHFGTARALGFEATLHSGVTVVHYQHLPPPPADLLVTAAGPVLQMLIGGAGLWWLHRLRRSRRVELASWLDWVATWCALNAGRWLGSPFRSAAIPTPDEVLLVKASGFPVPVGLAQLAVVATGAVILTVRLHPPGSRLIPFAYGCVGGYAGMQLWLHVIGPRLLA